MVNKWFRGKQMVGGYGLDGYKLRGGWRWPRGWRRSGRWWWRWPGWWRWSGWYRRLSKCVWIENAHGFHHLGSVPIETLFGYPFLSVFFIFDFVIQVTIICSISLDL